MNTLFQRIKSIVYLCIWILLVVIGWFLWFFGRDVWSYILLLAFGIGVGILSGLPPIRAFLACFFGFFVLALLYGSIFPDVGIGLILFGILCGLFAMAGAIIRRILFRRGIEDLYLKHWQWVLLICGVTILADYFIIFGTFNELFIYHRFLSFVRPFIPVLISLFALGLYTGTFSQLEYDELIKSVKRVSLEAHGIFMVYMIYLLAVGNISWKTFLMIPLIGLFFVIALKGTQIGYRFRSKDFLNRLT